MITDLLEHEDKNQDDSLDFSEFQAAFANLYSEFPCLSISFCLYHTHAAPKNLSSQARHDANKTKKKANTRLMEAIMHI